MSEFGHTQINDVISNSAGNSLDLVFTNITEMISPISEFPCIFPTDHAVLNFSLFVSKPRNKIKERLVYNYKHGQWDVLRSKIAAADLCAVIGNTTDVNEAWGGWLGLLEQFMSATIPRVKAKANRSHTWVDSEVRHLSHIKMTAWRRAKRSAKSNDWTNYKKLRKKLKNRMKHNHQTFVEDLSDKGKKNPKRFWSFFHEKTKSKAIPDILTDGISEYSDTAAKADLFSKYFQSVFHQDISPTHLNVENTRTENINLSSIEFDHLQIQKILSGLDANKASGPDNLSSRILKECATVLAPSLTLLFEMSFASGHIPAQWKQGNVVPFHKTVTNHRSQITDQYPFYV